MSSKHFDTMAEEWDSGDIRQNIANAVFQTITSRIALLNNMKIMDFGAGTGLLSFKIAPMVSLVTGVDLSSNMLQELEKKNTEQVTVKTVLQDIIKQPLDTTFHGVVSSMAMHHVEDTPRLFETFHAHLKRDGFIAIADLDAEDGTFHAKHGNDGVHHFGFDREGLRKTAENAGFHTVRFHDCYTVMNEQGEYPIFLMTAIKG